MHATIWHWSAKDFQNTRYWALTDQNNDLVILIKSNRFASQKTVRGCAQQKLKLKGNTQLGFKLNFTTAEWETWYAFNLCPTIELVRAGPDWEWTWKTVNPSE